MSRKVMLVLVTAVAILGVLLVPGLASATSAPETFDIVRLTDNNYDDIDQQVSGDHVVWSRSTTNEAYAWVNGGSIWKLSVSLGSASQPVVSGNRVVWVELREQGGVPEYDIAYSDNGGYSQMVLTMTAADEDSPQVDGDRVVFERTPSGGTRDIYVYTWGPSGGETRITDNAYEDVEPQISGDRVVWLGAAGAGGNNEVFTWEAGGDVTQITDGSYSASRVQVSGDRVVWQGNDKIWTWTPTSGGPQEIGSAVGTFCLDISGDRVVWNAIGGAGDVTTDNEIFTWVAGDSAPTQITDNGIIDQVPQVSGDRIVWESYSGSDSVTTDPEIFTWRAGVGTSQVTANDYDDYDPVVSGDRIAWDGCPPDHANACETYTAVLVDLGAPTVSDVAVDPASPTYGQSVTVTATAADAATAITSAEYKVDDGAWKPMSAADGAFDELSEAVTARVPDILSLGSHTVYVRATDSTGQTSYGDAHADFTMAGELGAQSYRQTRLTPSVAYIDHVCVSGDRLAWIEQDDIGSHVAVWTTTAGGTPEQVSAAGSVPDSLRISGDRLVWSARTSGVPNGVILTWTPPSGGSGGRVEVTDGTYDCYEPDVSGDIIVWTESVATSNSYIKVWDATTAISTVATVDTIADVWSPVVSGDRVAWLGWAEDTADVFTAPLSDLSADEQVTHTGGNEIHLSVSGGRLVWTLEDDAGELQVYTWVGGATTRLTEGAVDVDAPKVDGDRVVWYASKQESPDPGSIWMYTPSNGVQTLTGSGAPEEAAMGIREVTVSGDRVAWTVTGTGGDLEVWTWTDAHGYTRLTTNTSSDLHPAVSGDRIAWARTNGNYSASGYVMTAVPGADTAPEAAGGTSPNPATGTVALTVGFSSAGSTDDGAGYLDYSWNFGDGTPAGSGSSVSHTYYNYKAGGYTATLTVTDAAGQTDQCQFPITVNLPAGVTSAAAGMRLADMTLTIKTVRTSHYGELRVQVTDLAGNPVAKAKVTGTWSGAVAKNVSGTTGSDGWATITSAKYPASSTKDLTFTVTGITKRYCVYVTGANVVPLFITRM